MYILNDSNKPNESRVSKATNLPLVILLLFQMSVKLYKFDLSPPSRATTMMIDLLEIPITMIDINLLKREHLKPEYLKVFMTVHIHERNTNWGET